MSGDSNTEMNNKTTYRFKMDDGFVDLLYQFAKLHQHDDRATYKEAWNAWLQEHSEEIERETTRLIASGYHGDVKQKMYKSARYYFRKKPTKKSPPKDRRKYIGGSGSLIEAMDMHIMENIKHDNYRPSTGYDDFCDTCEDIIREDILRFIQEGMTCSDEIKMKIKKTYKNRYFQYIKNNSS